MVEDLHADCSRCSGLCCVALPYAASADFADDKPGGRPCRHLVDFSCSIHTELPERGFPGCVTFDCLGAGQQVTQTTYGGLTWRDRPDLAAEIFQAFMIMRQLQELRWYLRQADRADQPDELRHRIRELAERTRMLTGQRPAELLQIELAGHRGTVDVVLSAVCLRVRAAATRSVGDRRARPRRTRRADLVGAPASRQWTCAAATSAAPCCWVPICPVLTCAVATSSAPTCAVPT